MEYDNNWLLSLMVFLPLIGAAVVMLIPKAQEELVKAVALGTTLVTAALGVFMLFDFDYGKSGDLQYVVDKEWINVINSQIGRASCRERV